MNKQGFLSRVEIVTESGCWIWMGSINTGGYGYFCVSTDGKQKNYLAHRESYRMFTGEIPENKCVLHRCDVRSCVNPNHLFLGTPAENIADKVAKGRGAVGEKHGIAKLTERDVLNILQSDSNLHELSRQYGVSVSTVFSVVHRKNWKHV